MNSAAQEQIIQPILSLLNMMARSTHVLCLLMIHVPRFPAYPKLECKLFIDGILHHWFITDEFPLLPLFTATHTSSQVTFPIDFFEHNQQLTDVEFGGNDLLQVYNMQQIKHRLNSTGMYVASTKVRPPDGTHCHFLKMPLVLQF